MIPQEDTLLVTLGNWLGDRLLDLRDSMADHYDFNGWLGGTLLYLGGLVGLLAVLFVIFMPIDVLVLGHWEETTGTIIDMTHRPSTLESEVVPGVDPVTGNATTTVRTTGDAESNKIVIRTADGLVAVKVEFLDFYRFEVGQRVTLKQRVGRFTGLKGGWRIVR